MTDVYGELGVLASGGPCTAFCAAVRDNMPIIGSNPEDSVVRVAGAVHASDVHNLFERVTTTSGVYPAVLAFDADGQYIGHSDEAENEGNPSGDFVDVVVHQAEPGPIKQTTYLQISHDSPMCLSYVLQTVVDGIPAIWIGDVGRICGKEWYYSDTRICETDNICHTSSGAVFHAMGTPSLSNADFETMKAEITFRIAHGLMPITETTMNADIDPKQYCGEKSLSLRAGVRFENAREASTEAALFSSEDSRPSSKKRTQHSQSRGISMTRLVASHHDHHSASQLCESDDSWGPDLVSFSEQRFCDMEVKKHFPFCGEEQTYDCFDGKTLSIVTAEPSVAKNYSAVERMGCPPDYPTCGERCPLEWEAFCEGYGWGVGGPIHTYAPPPPRPTAWSPPSVKSLDLPTPTYY